MRGNNKFYEPPLVPQKLSNLKRNTVFDSHLKLKYLLHYLIICSVPEKEVDHKTSKVQILNQKEGIFRE